uniref:DUF349 domain-containing protein n=2 Tax=Roseivirga sp. TaxID=1964215 RepID=UPI0040482380
MEGQYGFIKEGKVFRNAFLDFGQREIGEVKDSEESTSIFFLERFNLAQAKVDQVEEKINATENKGSYLMKVLHLKETLHEFDALGDFEGLYKKLDLLDEQLSGFINQNRAKNLEIKTALQSELDIAAKSIEWKSATAAVKEIQRKWIKTGAVDDAQKEAIESNFKSTLDAFFSRRAEFYADLEKMMVEKEEDYKAFLFKAEKLKKLDNYPGLVDQIRDLREEWKLLGRIKKASSDVYWEQFQNIIKEALKASKKQKAKPASKNKAENLKLRSEFLKGLEATNEAMVPKANICALKEQWKKMGVVDKAEMLNLQEEFLLLIDQIAEKQFIESLLDKKTKANTSQAEKQKLRIKLLYDLLNRDKNELFIFNENLEKFNTSAGLDQLIAGKLALQERKVKVKEAILKQFRSAT